MGQTEDLKLSPQVGVYLLTENRLLRDTLARLLRKRSEINVGGVSRRSESVKDEILSSHCDVVLTDCFDSTAPSTFLRDILEQNSAVKLLLFGMNEDPEVFFNAVYLGICGYLLKDASATEIVAAVRAAIRGEATCPPSLCMALIQHLSKKKAEKFEPPHPRDADHKALTPRQLQLLELVADGLTNKEIAEHLNVSQFTVKNHISRVMRQVEAANRYDAVDMVRATGKLVPS